MYRWYASLDQGPNVQIRQSGTPATDAVVAAPIRKLCMENWVWFRPRHYARDLIALFRECVVMAVPDDHCRRGNVG